MEKYYKSSMNDRNKRCGKAGGRKRRRRKGVLRVRGIAAVTFLLILVTTFWAVVMETGNAEVFGNLTLSNIIYTARNENDTTNIVAGKTKDTKSLSSHIIEAEGLSQDKIPTGCEAVTTVAALRYWKIDITADRFIDKFLPKENFITKNGVIYGADPHKAFAGDPYGSGLGCFSEVIVSSCIRMKSAGIAGMKNLVIENISGTEPDDLEMYIANDIPVIFWATVDMKAPYDGMKYKLHDNSTYMWKSGEHCMLLIGYDSENYFFLDPLKDGKMVSYGKTLVKARYEQMGKQAVAIYKSDVLY